MSKFEKANDAHNVPTDIRPKPMRAYLAKIAIGKTKKDKEVWTFIFSTGKNSYEKKVYFSLEGKPYRQTAEWLLEIEDAFGQPKEKLSETLERIEGDKKAVCYIVVGREYYYWKGRVNWNQRVMSVANKPQPESVIDDVLRIEADTKKKAQQQADTDDTQPTQTEPPKEETKEPKKSPEFDDDFDVI